MAPETEKSRDDSQTVQGSCPEGHRFKSCPSYHNKFSFPHALPHTEHQSSPLKNATNQYIGMRSINAISILYSCPSPEATQLTGLEFLLRNCGGHRYKKYFHRRYDIAK